MKKYKTFLATYKPVGGVIRVVLVREPDRWVAYFSTDPDLSVASILETVADRSALEQVFHDVKEVHGAGQQQLRHVWANVGAWNLIGWWHTLVELWAWDRPQSRLRDRSDSPWDKPERRPSHANRCQELRREALQEEYSSLPSVGGLCPKIRRFIQRLMRRVVAYHLGGQDDPSPVLQGGKGPTSDHRLDATWKGNVPIRCSTVRSLIGRRGNPVGLCLSLGH